MNKLWLPTGAHWDLNISHSRLEDSGAFIDAGWKFILHTAESSRDTATLIRNVVRDKRAAPHLVFGYDPNTRFPLAIQCLPFNVAARTLMHTFPEETNRARCIQMEICGRAADSHRWSDNYYKGLANVCRMVERRVPIPRRAPISFGSPHRMTPSGFVRARGWFGHSMVPGNDHTDPGAFDIEKLFHYMERANDHGLELKPVNR